MAATTAALALGLWAADLAMADQQIGAAAVVVNSVTGTIPGTQERSVLRRGIDVFQNEIIDTAESSASHVVFQDSTDLQIGPSSRVSLDRFVFDPDPSQSQLVLYFSQGVARFSSGVLPKSNYALRTPSASIGIRGTVLTITVTPAIHSGPQVRGDLASTISVESGIATVTAQGATVSVNSGYSTYVAFGAAPVPPFLTSPSPAVSQMDTLLASPGGQRP